MRNPCKTARNLNAGLRNKPDATDFQRVWEDNFESADLPKSALPADNAYRRAFGSPMNAVLHFAVLLITVLIYDKLIVS